MVAFGASEKALADTAPILDFPGVFTFRLEPNTSCPAAVAYEAVEGMAYYMKGGKLVDERSFKGSSFVAVPWRDNAKPGDRVTIQVTHFYGTNAKGQKKAFTKPVIKIITFR
ncbi:hypothetical protein GCM10023183_02170 [Nibribacter koreensis]|uniref:Uncharacterized protein n=2 Tax=Nibribacter koreensis TaxID=1084519 RepID=A0ABP8F686_9BACT